MPLAFAPLLLASALTPQVAGGAHEVQWQFRIRGPQDQLGYEVECAGDFDFDGVPDPVVARGYPAAAAVHSGTTGGLIRVLPFPVTGSFALLGLAVIPDLDGDLVPEVAMGASAVNQVVMVSGATGAVLWSRAGSGGNTSFGRFVVAVGDLDGDGHQDLMVMEPGRVWPATGKRGVYYLLSGATGATIYEVGVADFLTASGEADRVCATDDVDGDGVGDWMAGSPQTLSVTPRAFLFSGASGTIIREYLAPAGADGYFGASVASAGDCDGDGVPDQLIGDLYGNQGSGVVYAYSGASGAPLWTASGAGRYGRFGHGMLGGRDLDGDGRDDVIVGENGHFQGSSGAILSGADGSRLGSLAPDAGRGMGRHFAWLDRTSANPLAAVAFTGTHSVAGVTHSHLTLATWHPGLRMSANSLSAASGGDVQFELRFPRELAGQPYAILASASGTGPVSWNGLDIPLSLDGMLRRTVRAPLPGFARAQGTLNAAAQSRARWLVAAGTATARAGSSLWFSAVVGTPAGPRAASIPRRLDIHP